MSKVQNIISECHKEVDRIKQDFSKYSPNIFDEQLINNDIYKHIAINQMIIIKSPVITGTMDVIKKVVGTWINPIISIVHENVMISSHMTNYGLHKYDDIQNSKNIVVKIDCLDKIDIMNFKDGLVILDELNKTLRTVPCPFEGKGLQLFDILKNILRVSSKVLVVDDIIDNNDINLLFSMKPTNKLYFYQNKCATGKGVPYYIHDSIAKMKKQLLEDMDNDVPFIAYFNNVIKMNDVLKNYQNTNNKTFVASTEIMNTKHKKRIKETKGQTKKMVYFTPALSNNNISVKVYCFVYDQTIGPDDIFEQLTRTKNKTEIHMAFGILF